MSGTGAMNCDQLRGAMRQGYALTGADLAHVEHCEECLEMWLDATVTQALDAKPEVTIPADFSARVAAGLPAKPGGAEESRRGRYREHWGLITAIVLVAAELLAMALTDPHMMATRMGVVFMVLVATEIAGIALWLGCWPHGRTTS